MGNSSRRYTTHSNLNYLVILGGSSLKPEELEWLLTFSISLDSCSPSCRQMWKCFPVWNMSSPTPMRHSTQAWYTHRDEGKQEWESDRREGVQEARFPPEEPACLAFPSIQLPPPSVHCRSEGNHSLTLANWTSSELDPCGQKGLGWQTQF